MASNHDYGLQGYDPRRQVVLLWNPWGNTHHPKGQPGREHGYPTSQGRFEMPLHDLVEIYNDVVHETALPLHAGRPGHPRKIR